MLLKEIATVKGGKRLPKSDSLVSEKTDHPYIRIRDMYQSYPLELNDDFEYITSETYEKIKKYTVEQGDVIIAVVGNTIGLVSVIGESLHGANLTENCNKIVDIHNYEGRFLYYFLTSAIGQNEIKKGIVGSSQPKLPIYNIEKIQLPDFPLEEQARIVEVLETIDKKISNNEKINENLEQQAQAYFNELFVVNADPNWPECTLSDIGSVVAGGTPSKSKPEYYADQGIAWITPKDLSVDKSKFISHGENDISELGFSKSSTKKMPAGTVLFSSRAPIGYIAIAQNELTTNQGFKSVIPNKNIGTSYVYFLLKNLLPAIEGMASGSTFKEISGAGMKSVPTVMPDVDTIQLFNNFCEPIFKEQEVLEAENRRLSALRDLLLPKLMSGEIDIPSLDN